MTDLLTDGWKKKKRQNKKSSTNRNCTLSNWKAGYLFNGYTRLKAEHQIQREYRYQVIGSTKRRPRLGIVAVHTLPFLTAMTSLRNQLRISLVFSDSHWKKETNIISARATNHHWLPCYLNVNSIHVVVGKGITRLKAEWTRSHGMDYRSTRCTQAEKSSP